MNFSHTKQFHIPEDGNLHRRCHENLIFWTERYSYLIVDRLNPSVFIHESFCG